MATLNTFQKAIIEKANQMNSDEAQRWVSLVGKQAILDGSLSFQIGRFVDGGTLVIQAFVNGELLTDGPATRNCSVIALLGLSEFVKSCHLTDFHRQAIKQALNDNAKVVLAELDLF